MKAAVISVKAVDGADAFKGQNPRGSGALDESKRQNSHEFRLSYIPAMSKTEEEGFEPSRRCYRPTGVRSQTLQPLGYSSR